ncbi:MAG: DUF1732 domain-containing protein [Candidatus Aminicenantes bacterium]|nr:DUF1732 domain-containing protein [Candidatus Aminicenantes bacterium]
MKSMTGFAQGRCSGDNFSMFLSFKSLNHRFLDINFKGTGISPQFEKLIKELFRDKIFRGKIEINFNLFESNPKKWDIQFNESLLDEILKKVLSVKAKHGENVHLSLDSMLRFPMIFHLDYIFDNFEPKKSREIRATIKTVFYQFLQNRITEGECIFTDLMTSIQNISENMKSVEKEAKKLEKENFIKYKEKILRFLKGVEIDEKRIAQEAAITAEKYCIIEEINRLKAHHKRIRQLAGNKKVPTKGRELDFLCQEMQRETYTIASKINSMTIHDRILLIRREIEKMRQQIQNVE